MSILTVLFYVIAALITASTAMAVTRRNMVHAVLYLVLSFFGTAMLFYLLGAPFLAALEIIIYAGAIMVLFLFLMMMIRENKLAEGDFSLAQLLPALLISAGFVVGSMLLIGGNAVGRSVLKAAQASPMTFGIYLFQTHWLAVEIASLLLLVALVGAYVLGRKVRGPSMQEKEELP
jgi:NADH-quinone oxidoreductase subunit J